MVLSVLRLWLRLVLPRLLPTEREQLHLGFVDPADDRSGGSERHGRYPGRVDRAVQWFDGRQHQWSCRTGHQVDRSGLQTIRVPEAMSSAMNKIILSLSLAGVVTVACHAQQNLTMLKYS